jgi:hypothetical protein
MAFLGLGALFLDRLFKLIQFLSQLSKRLHCGIGFLSAFLCSAEIGFLCSLFLILTTVSCIVRSMRAFILLAEVTMLLGVSFLGDSESSISTMLLVSFLALVGSFLAGLCAGLFLRTFTLYPLVWATKLLLAAIGLVCPALVLGYKSFNCSMYHVPVPTLIEKFV